jgi:glycosyltransferase involved in cell wall biosynthesis
MIRAALLTPSITTGDAVSNDVLGMYEILNGLGHETRIYAEGWTFSNPKIRPAQKINSFLRANDLLIYHYSRGWDLGLDLIKSLRCKTAVRYHNVTPPKFFEGINNELAEMCLTGRQQLLFVARAGCDRYLSDSPYNEGELVEGGVPKAKSRVVPPFHHIDRLAAVEPDAELLERYSDGVTNILMVGRIAPNKNHPDLIQAFAAYHHDYNPKSRLIVVGKAETRLSAYNRWLKQIAVYLKVENNVVFTGEVSDHELKSYYTVADVFLMTSEHEGFCVPLVEAMSMNVPIVAYGSSAIPDTVDDAGLVWPDRNPYLLAESIHSIVTNREVSDALAGIGQRRYQENFTNEKIRTKFIDAIEDLL